jgi:hypothetical protein
MQGQSQGHQKPGQYLLLLVAREARRRALRRNLQRAEGGRQPKQRTSGRQGGRRGLELWMAPALKAAAAQPAIASLERRCRRVPCRAVRSRLLSSPASTQGRQETVRGCTAALWWAAI